MNVKDGAPCNLPNCRHSESLSVISPQSHLRREQVIYIRVLELGEETLGTRYRVLCTFAGLSRWLQLAERFGKPRVRQSEGFPDAPTISGQGWLKSRYTSERTLSLLKVGTISLLNSDKISPLSRLCREYERVRRYRPRSPWRFKKRAGARSFAARISGLS